MTSSGTKVVLKWYNKKIKLNRNYCLNSQSMRLENHSRLLHESNSKK